MVLVEPAESHGSEVYVPDSVSDFFEADVLAFEDVADVDLSVVEADAAVGADVAQFEVIGIVDVGQFGWELTR